MKPRTTLTTKKHRTADHQTGCQCATDQAVDACCHATDGLHEQIAKEAYLRAERRGFAPGCELDDWLAAEATVNGQDSSRQQSA